MNTHIDIFTILYIFVAFSMIIPLIYTFTWVEIYKEIFILRVNDA